MPRRVGRPRKRRGPRALLGAGRRRRRGGNLFRTKHRVLTTHNKLVSHFGHGRRRRRHRKRRGGNIIEYFKKHRIISRGIHALSKHVPNHYARKIVENVRNIAATKGYGRRRRRKHRKRRRGGMVYRNVGIARVQGGRHRRRRRHGRRRRHRGGNIGDWFNQLGRNIYHGATHVNNFLRKHKVLSNVGKVGSMFLPPGYNVAGEAVAHGLDLLGYGKRKRRCARGGGRMPVPTRAYKERVGSQGPFGRNARSGIQVTGAGRKRRRHGGNNPYPTTNSSYARWVF